MDGTKANCLSTSNMSQTPNSPTPEPPKHRLKTWPKQFKDMVDGVKTFDVRRADRDYKVGDHLWYVEFDPNKEQLTGKDATFVCTYVMPGSENPKFGVGVDFVVMSIQPLYVDGICVVEEERLRQIREENFSAEHDDRWIYGEMASVAALYALPMAIRSALIDKIWPERWSKTRWWKPASALDASIESRIKDLKKAGALICAEIDRLIRAKRLRDRKQNAAR